MALQVMSFATALVALVVGLSLLASLFLVLPIAARLAVPLGRLGRERLERLAQARWVPALGAGTVVALGGGAFVVAQGDISRGLSAAVLMLMTAAVALPAAVVPREAVPRRATWIVRAAAGLACLALLGSGVLLSARPGADRVVGASLGASLVSEALRELTDWDRDGASSFFGGRDCAPFDARRSPLAVEIPGNGIDEDCDGEDGAPSTHTSAAPISGRLHREQVSRYNVVLIVVDALRADRLQAAGYKRALTSEIERLGKEGSLFLNATSQSSATRVSFPSFLTGKNPTRLAWKKSGRRYQPADSEVMLQEVLKQAGYATAFVANHWFEEHVPEVLRGFDLFRSAWFDKDFKRWRNGSAPATTTRAIEILEANPKGKPLFLTVYYEGPHAPYHDLTARGVPSFGRRAVDRYDQEVFYADRHIGFLLDYLRSKPELWEQTVVIVTADHGEGFMEHGKRHHGSTCYAEMIQVPVVLRVPGMKAEVVRAPVALVDLVPTILELTGVDAPGALDGQSLFYTTGGPAPERPIFCATFNDENPKKTLLGSLTFEGHTLIVQPGNTGYELYAVADDPKQTRDLSNEPEHQERLKRLQALFKASTSAKFVR
jgi:arylsulfatase A-like enzyme